MITGCRLSAFSRCRRCPPAHAAPLCCLRDAAAGCAVTDDASITLSSAFADYETVTFSWPLRLHCLATLAVSLIDYLIIATIRYRNFAFDYRHFHIRMPPRFSPLSQLLRQRAAADAAAAPLSPAQLPARCRCQLQLPCRFCERQPCCFYAAAAAMLPRDMPLLLCCITLADCFASRLASHLRHYASFHHTAFSR
jgi:hypothetical protein